MSGPDITMMNRAVKELVDEKGEFVQSDGDQKMEADTGVHSTHIRNLWKDPNDQVKVTAPQPENRQTEQPTADRI